MGPASDRRQPAWRWRQYRRRGGRQGRAGRLHAACSPIRRRSPSTRRFTKSPRLRSGRLRADLAQVAAVPLVLAVPPKEEATTVRELIALAKAHPGQPQFRLAGSWHPGPSRRRAVQIDGGDSTSSTSPWARAARRRSPTSSAGRRHRYDVHLSSRRCCPRSMPASCARSASAANSATPISCSTHARSGGQRCRDIRPRPGSRHGGAAGHAARRRIASKLSSAVAEVIHQPDMAKRLVDMSATAIGDTPKSRWPIFSAMNGNGLAGAV